MTRYTGEIKPYIFEPKTNSEKDIVLLQPKRFLSKAVSVQFSFPHTHLLFLFRISYSEHQLLKTKPFALQTNIGM